MQTDSAQSLDLIRAIQPDDHIRGNPQAPLSFIVYSDFGCPYCKDFHETMQKVMDLYGKNGQVAWVYRHIPVVQLHPQSGTYALASECVASLGGENAFWTFADQLFEAVTPDTTLDAAGILDLAARVGIDERELAACMRNGSFTERIERDFKEAVDAGASGSPFVVVIAGDRRISREGALPFAAVAGIIRIVQDAGSTNELRAPDARDPGAAFTEELVESVRSSSSEASNNTPEE